MIRRTLGEIRDRARAELRVNPTITVYTFSNGVERRRPANPWAGIGAQLRSLRGAFRDLTIAFEEIGRKFAIFVEQNKLSQQRYWSWDGKPNGWHQ